MDRTFELVLGDLFNLFPIEYRSAEMRDLAAEMNRYRDEIFKSGQGYGENLTIEDFAYIYLAERCPPKMLDYLAASIGVEISSSMTDRERRNKVFKGIRLHKLHGTVQMLIIKIEEVTGVTPDILYRGVDNVGWDQLGDSNADGAIQPPASPVDFYGGILNDQINEYTEAFAPASFIWQVYRTSLLIDIKSDAVFDPDPVINADILRRTYDVIARFKEATVVATAGYIDSVTGFDTLLKEIYSRDLILNPGDPIPPEFEPRVDPGLF